MGRTSNAKERLLNATIELIWHYSYCSVGVDAICERAGVKKGSFYHFFSSKADLAAEAIQTHWEGYQLEMDTLFCREVPPLQRLRAYFDKVYCAQRDRQAHQGCIGGCPYFDLGTEIATLDGEIATKISQVLDQYFCYFATAVEDAQRAGQISVKDSACAARWLMYYFQGALTNARIHNDLSYLRDLSSGAFQLLGAHDVQE
jgi:TetR/AcrR family transcriptional repressor of nem operon